jgi:hypothetical protein
MPTGTLKMWNADRGYGFIADDAGEKRPRWGVHRGRQRLLPGIRGRFPGSKSLTRSACMVPSKHKLNVVAAKTGEARKVMFPGPLANTGTAPLVPFGKCFTQSI